MSTRITGGKDRGRRIRSARGASLRPTTERVRAAIFSILGPEAVKGARVLDLYAGIGTLGIEALSRGASWVDFIEVDSGRCRAIRESLSDLGVEGSGRVHRTAVEKALGKVGAGYDLVLADPPYDLEPWDLMMDGLDSGKMLSEKGLVVIEHRRHSGPAETHRRMVRVTSRHYGDSAISIYRTSRPNG